MLYRKMGSFCLSASGRNCSLNVTKGTAGQPPIDPTPSFGVLNVKSIAKKN